MKKLSNLKKTFLKLMGEIETLPNNEREMKIARRILEKIKYIEHQRGIRTKYS